MAVLHLGYGGGKRLSKCYYAKTRAEVAGKLTAATRDRQQGKNPVREQEKLGSFLETWLEDVCSRTVKDTTHRGYSVSVRRHIIPALGHKKLARLTASDLDSLYARLLAEGLANRTVRLCHAVLHRVLSHALRRGMVAVNVADAVDPPRVSRKEFRALDAGEAKAFLEATRGDRLYGLFALALSTGMRQGELLGVRWGDIDLNTGTLSVRQQCYRLDSEWRFTEPKTARGRRSITLSAMAVAALRERQQAQRIEEVHAETWEDKDLVFTDLEGGPIGAQTLRRVFWPLLRKAGLPRIRFHDLRHSAASMLLAANTHVKIVSEMLGHSTVAITLDTYSHVTPNLQQSAAEKMDKLLAVNS